MNWMLSALLFAATANAIAQQPAPAVEMTPAETAFQQMLTIRVAYAGTWGGGDTGGKMFGNIVKNESK